LGRYRENSRGEQKNITTYKCFKKCLKLGLTDRVDESEVGDQVQIERECGEAETDVTQEAAEIESGDVFEDQR